MFLWNFEIIVTMIPKFERKKTIQNRWHVFNNRVPVAHKLVEKLLAFPATIHILGLPLENYNHHQFTTHILGVTLENVHIFHVAGCWLVLTYEL